ncbi:MAG: ATP-binding cassette domain-containing protein [Verrucomicrobia bacterium]|nr:ATP-binding cassette domain-containing protein [Verrucomicrobiota bacterium]
MNHPLLSLTEISLKVPSKETPILDNLSLDIFRGEFIILLGSNGCGKSSLLKVVNGLSTPTSGSLYFKKENLLQKSLTQRSKSIVTLTQDLNLSTFSDLTVLENCLIALHRNKLTSFSFSSKEKQKKIKAYLEIYNPNLAEKLAMPVSSLSGGERQTLALAMNLWISPSLLLLDEHTSALDPYMAKKLMHLTHEITERQQVTTVVATHNLDDALTYGTRLIVMKQGKIILDVPHEEKRKLTYEMLLSLYSK